MSGTSRANRDAALDIDRVVVVEIRFFQSRA